MFIFAVFMIVSIVLFIYYKVAILKEKEKLVQVYLNAKSKVCLGTFILFFGINQYISYQTRLSLFIGLIFVVLGFAQALRGFKEAKHYKSEWKRLHIGS